MDAKPSPIAELIAIHSAELREAWLKELATDVKRAGLLDPDELNAQCTEFLNRLQQALQEGAGDDVAAPEWGVVREYLTDISQRRANQGFSPADTATFVFSLKRPLFVRLQKDLSDAQLASQIWRATELLDALGLHVMEAYQKSREEIIARQQDEMLELSTPVVKLWDGILALPLIGTLDSSRTQVVMETLLQRIVDTNSIVAIIDITGVPTVDTLVAQHLIKTVSAAKLMGVECIVSGVRPQIAQTIVHLGVGLGDIITKQTLADAFRVALGRVGMTTAPLPQSA